MATVFMKMLQPAAGARRYDEIEIRLACIKEFGGDGQEIETMKHLRGSCVCAAVRYEISAEPVALFCCHCTECQTASGSSFVLALKLPYGGVTVIEGEAKPYLRPEADGQKRNVFRCPKCLAALWSERLDSKDYITVYAGTLDNSSMLKPAAHIWTRDAQPWIALPKESLQFPENPPDMEPIVQAWRRMQSQAAPANFP